jgi:DNA-directed RNA polymerase specialized sigma24 family protein
VAGNDWLVDQFEAHRNHLRAVAYRMLGSQAEGDDAVQEAWVRLNRSDAGEIENLGGWLTTVVGRASLDMLRSCASRREEPAGSELPDHIERTAGPTPSTRHSSPTRWARHCWWSSTRGRPKVVWDFTIEDGKVVHIDMLAAPDSLDRLDLTIVDE